MTHAVAPPSVEIIPQTADVEVVRGTTKYIFHITANSVSDLLAQASRVQEWALKEEH